MAMIAIPENPLGYGYAKTAGTPLPPARVGTNDFGPAELLARIRVAERHRGAGQPRDAVVYEHGGLRIDVGQQSVTRDGRPLHLTRKELQLLCLLARQPGCLYTHRQLLQEAWGAKFVEHTHYLRI